MSRALKAIIIVGSLLLGVGLFLFMLNQPNVSVIQTDGIIANRQRDLLFFATGLMMIVIVPVFLLTFLIGWKYHAGNKKADYKPDWDHNLKFEAVWWGIPIAIIIILGTVTWQSSHELDPYKPLASSVKPVNVQVIALEWKWLFLYPDEGIATINQVRFPEKTPVNFTITSDAPMNSFWIPDLAGQIYAMNGMSTKLHVMADRKGIFRGVSANISGEGFSGMKFSAISTTNTEYKKWVRDTKKLAPPLSKKSYPKIAAKSKDVPATFYKLEDKDLYDMIIHKYMMPENKKTMTNDKGEHSMHCESPSECSQ